MPKTNYLLNLEIKSESGQLLRCTDLHFNTRKEALKNTSKMIWIIASIQSSIYEGFTQEIFYCKNGEVLKVKLRKYTKE